MTTRNLLLLPGDGIGPEVMGATKTVIDWFNGRGAGFAFEEDLVGGCAYDAHGKAISDATMEKALAADAVLLGLGRRAEMGRRALRRAARGGAARACARTSRCSPISARRSATRRWPIPPRSSASWSRASTS